MKGPFSYLFGGIFSVVGLSMLVGGLYVYTTQKAFLTTAQSAQGVVEKLVYDRSRRGKSGVYYPVVQFQTPDGQIHSFRSDSGTNPPSYDTGQQVEVLYDPANPSKAILTGFWNTWGLTTIFGVLGIVFSAIGLSSILKKRRSQG